MILNVKPVSPESLLKLPTTLRNLTPAELGDHCLRYDSCRLATSGAVVAYSGAFTGRTPKDKFLVRDSETEAVVWWDGNSAISEDAFTRVESEICGYLAEKRLFVVDALAGADPRYQIRVRFIVERPYHALFVSQLFIKPSREELESFEPDWTVLDAGRLKLDSERLGLRSSAAILLNLSRSEILIAGTEYAGEMKKSIFTVMNYLLPRRGVMSMHCSANVGPEGDTALFFGLSGTGKTSLSADPGRSLIGDDEHGWSDEGVFNIEGGCYAKCINLMHEKEPEIWDAIRPGAVLENVLLDDAGEAKYSDQSITENTRAAYPLDFVPNAVHPSVGGHPENIFFLTCDALGLLPPISRLTPHQVLFYFLNGYTAKVAGTEAGVTEPTLAFSTCFGQPFLPLSPHTYGSLLQQKILKHRSRVWLLNTGWTGGGYGEGSRISISHTRSMLNAALSGRLDDVPYTIHPIFELQSPISCPDVPSELLDPRSTWKDETLYDKKARQLQDMFEANATRFGTR